ncbi:PcfJ domain-containing protein [Aeromonas veronii]|nr:PcfJ domain-containing protein [Aeromonas veronii]
MTLEAIHYQETLPKGMSLSSSTSGAPKTKEISLDGLLQLCIERGVFRILKEESDSKNLHLTICGVFRVVKNLKTESVSFQLLHQKNGRLEWLATKEPPCEIPLFYRKSYFVNDWVTFAIKRTIDLLLLDGYTIRGNMWLWDVETYNGKHSYASLIEKPYKELSFTGSQVISKTLHHFSLSSTKVVGAPVGYSYGFNEPQLTNLISSLIDLRCWNFLDIKTRNSCGRSLAYHAWHYVNKEQCSQYLRSVHSSKGYPALYSTLHSYLTFCKKVNVNKDHEGVIGSLWPFIGLLIGKEGPFHISGKLRELYKLISPTGISYGDFKALRNGSIRVCASIANMPSTKISTSEVTVNMPDYDIPESPFCFDQDDCRIAIKIMRNPLSKLYPSSVILDIIEGSISGRIPDGLGDKIYRVCEQWLDYNKGLYKRIGFKKSSFRWYTETNSLSHVLDWVRMEKPEIHKNQSWHSFWRLAEEWTQRWRAESNPDLLELPTEWSGTGIEWGDGIVELTSGDLLRKEGTEMEHCVAGYHEECSNGSYFAFSIELNGERGTLGIMNTNSDFIIDQIRGFDNKPVSKLMENHCKTILKTISIQADL